MISLTTLCLSVLVTTAWCGDHDFPPGFKFGAATASYQVEGAWNVSGKGESIWDRFTHSRPEMIWNGDNGDVACDSYHKWQEDIDIAAKLGLHYYRFSISWPRILPNGLSNEINEDGVRYYNNLIDGLLAKGIEPVVTMYHWDLPQRLQDLGGWTNPLISDYFADYARVLYNLYADRVKDWLTINEPISLCDVPYMMGILAPGLLEPKIAPFVCTKNYILAHAKAWRIYDEEFRHKYNGRVSVTQHFYWCEAGTEENEELAELVNQYGLGRYVHPIFSEKGGWPPSLEKYMAEISEKEGYSFSRLPPFTQEEIELARGAYDYLGINYYTSRIVRKAEPNEDSGIWPSDGVPDLNAILEIPGDYDESRPFFLFSYPVGVRHLLSWLRKEYGNIEVKIMENGFSTQDDSIDDEDRRQYYEEHMEQVLLAIKEDGANVTSYTAWTLLDNFEWMDGYSTKFGLVKVDFEDPERTRTLRKSAHYYAEVIKHHSLDIPGDYKNKI